MHHPARLLIFLAVLTAAAQDTSKPQFTARELFYRPAAEQTPAANATPTAVAPKKAVSPKKPAVSPAPRTDVVNPPPPQPVQPMRPQLTPDTGTIARTAALVTAPAPESGIPLGVKYTILRKSGDDMVEVPPDTVFHSGDRIQVKVQTNSSGYLYVITQGSSGTWKAMFPSSELADGDNHVDSWSASVLPPKSRWLFDEQTGTERVFIVFSRVPEEGLENMIYSLQDGKSKPPAEKAPQKPSRKSVISASAIIPDGAVEQLRDTYTRDLVIEKVDDQTPQDKSPANKNEYAVYVINPSGSADSRVVADLKLVHQ
jgi:Domain of unknown function (DUF4384)